MAGETGEHRPEIGAERADRTEDRHGNEAVLNCGHARVVATHRQ